MNRTFPKEKKSRPGQKRSGRPIHIDGKVWRWQFGGIEGIIIKSPDGQTYPVSPTEVAGIPEDADVDWFCDCDDCKDARAITPGKIKEYILNSIRWK